MDQEEYETLLEITARCQLMDIDELRAGIKGKARSGSPSNPVSDLEFAYDAMEAEARATLQLIQDRKIARSVEHTSQEDIDLINTIAEIERREQADRQYALSLSTNPSASPPPSPTGSSLGTPASGSAFGGGPIYQNIRYESPFASSSSSLSWSTFDAPLGPRSSGSSLFDSVKPRAGSSTGKSAFVPSILRLPVGRSSVDCVICADSTSQAYQAPCGCFYDRQCLTELFDKATVDESLFPPSSSPSQKSSRRLIDYTAATLVAQGSLVQLHQMNEKKAQDCARNAGGRLAHSAKMRPMHLTFLARPILQRNKFLPLGVKKAGRLARAVTTWLSSILGVTI
ncbi:hypothetical protein RhiXN_05228 [Rhizoctonia solani]|uniref:IBR domain-containing protein n=1 Tax=Rhizoctonia solani TaxID=456999 RepID=A0A8H8NRQ6_9AGAM|nr:uncharacterized protein RhiXN_05228 [Rhizoctonia solani]QRW17226.1 hypothetical protein RhiXN_05228 [Rhizoctonia solani]